MEENGNPRVRANAGLSPTVPASLHLLRKGLKGEDPLKRGLPWSGKIDKEKER